MSCNGYVFFLIRIELVHSDGSVAWNLGFGYWKSSGKMGLTQVEQSFFQFLVKKLCTLSFFKVEDKGLACTAKLLKFITWHIPLLKDLAKNEDKPCSNYNPLLGWYKFITSYPKIWYWLPYSSLFEHCTIHNGRVCVCWKICIFSSPNSHSAGLKMGKNSAINYSNY